MFSPITPLYSALGTLKGPMTNLFDPDAWRSIVGDDGDLADQRLLRSALWIAEQTAAARSRGDKAKLLDVGGRRAAILAVAAMNREMLCVMKDQRKSRSSDDAGLAFDHIASRPTLETGGGALAAADDVIEIAVGLAESWLYDSYLQPVEGEPSELSVEALILGGGRVYSLQRNHNDLWNQARWDGWGLDPSGTRWQPADREFSTLEDSWRARSQANTMSHAWLIVTEWKHYTPRQRRDLSLKRTVESIQRSPRGLKIKVGRPSDLALRKPAHYALDRASLDDSYLAPLVDDDFPKAPGLNANLLLMAWHVITDLTRRMMVGLDDSQIEDRLEDFALLIRGPALSEALASALDVGPDLADRIIDFLTYRSFPHGGRLTSGVRNIEVASVS